MSGTPTLTVTIQTGTVTISATPGAGPFVVTSDPANGAVLKTNPTQLMVAFNKDVLHDGSVNAADNVINYLLLSPGANKNFDTASCAGGRAGDDTLSTILSAAYSNNGGSGPFKSILSLAVPLPAGTYRLLVCGTTSIQDAAGNKINGGLDSVINFRVETSNPKKLPGTGFAPGVVSVLPQLGPDSPYFASDLTLKIASLGVSMPIVGVPVTDNEWDVSWLGNNAGWLENTAFPTWTGNSVITGHVWNADNTPGMFVNLKTLKYGDKVDIYAWRQIYTYEVRENLLIQPDQSDLVLQHKQESWLTLLTCEGYNTSTSSYASRRLVRAVLVKVTITK
jgi:LPXTG-site transpeptidase (sortase) family protein